MLNPQINDRKHFGKTSVRVKQIIPERSNKIALYHILIDQQLIMVFSQLVRFAKVTSIVRYL